MPREYGSSNPTKTDVQAGLGSRLPYLIDFVGGMLNSRPWLGIAVISLLYWAMTLWLAAHRVLWIDELYTLYDVRQKTFGDIWHFMQSGAEQTPPYFMFVTHAVISLFGVSQITLRLLAMVGFWIAMLCLYRIVSRYSTPLFGMVAMTFPMATPVYYYSSEARGYGLVLGFASLALVCWLEIGTGSTPPRKWATFGLAACLALATCFHYYAIVLPVPLAIGELTLMLSGGRLRWKVWLAFCTPLLPVMGSYSIIMAARSGVKIFYFKPQFYFAITWFDIFLSSAPVLAIMAAFIFREKFKTISELKIPAHVIAALLGFITLPLLCDLVAFVTGAYSHRYALSAILGVAILFSLALAKFNNSALNGLSAIAIFLLFAYGFTKREVRNSRDTLAAIEGCRDMVKEAGLPKMPVLFGSGEQWSRLQQYPQAFPDTEALYPIDTDHKRGSIFMITWLFGIFRQIMPPGIIDFGSLPNYGKRFEVYIGARDEDRWLVPALIKDGWTLSVVAERNDGWLFKAEHP